MGMRRRGLYTAIGQSYVATAPRSVGSPVGRSANAFTWCTHRSYTSTAAFIHKMLPFTTRFIHNAMFTDKHGFEYAQAQPHIAYLPRQKTTTVIQFLVPDHLLDVLNVNSAKINTRCRHSVPVINHSITNAKFPQIKSISFLVKPVSHITYTVLAGT